MKRILFLLFVPLMITGCQAQNEKKAENEKSDISKNQIAQNIEPKVDVRVNKKYDDNGNLIEYDSTYTWSYSTINGDSANVSADSVFSEFRPFYDKHFPDFNNPLNYGFFDMDSLFYNDFLSPGYFYDRWQKNLIEQDKIFRRMDSIKNEFFKHHYPGLIKPEK